MSIFSGRETSPVRTGVNQGIKRNNQFGHDVRSCNPLFRLWYRVTATGIECRAHPGQRRVIYYKQISSINRNKFLKIFSQIFGNLSSGRLTIYLYISSEHGSHVQFTSFLMAYLIRDINNCNLLTFMGVIIHQIYFCLFQTKRYSI